MRGKGWLIAGLIMLVLVAGLGWMLFHKKGSADEAADAAPTATITIAPVRQETVGETVSVYGVVQNDQAGAVTVAAPRASILLRVLVRAGQIVSAGQPLVEIANAPSSDVAFRQAQDAAVAARADLARVERLYADHLAANDQLIAAKKALADAEAALAAQQKQGASHEAQLLSAPQAGIVTTVAQAPGDHVAQDAPLVVLARSGAGVAKLGLEPNARIAPGDAVTIWPVAGGGAIASRISMVGRAADQNTKTLDAIAPISGAGLPIGAAVRAEIKVGSHSGLLAPRAAVVFDETGAHVFTVSGGKAHRVFVTVGADHGEDIELSGPLAPGASVAVEGAYELQDGMAVKVARR